MKIKRTLLPLVLAPLALFIISFRMSDGSDPDLIADFEQNPPAVLGIKMKKLAAPLADGSKMLLAITYDPGLDLPASLSIYHDGNVPVAFYDDESHGDEMADDNVFTAYLKADPDELAGVFQNMENSLTDQGSYLTFNGHLGTLSTQIPHFNADAVSNLAWVDIPNTHTYMIDCSSYDIVKENSLLITDQGVVENPARTMNPLGSSANGYKATGNPLGSWNFGQLMKNIANAGQTGVTAKSFLKDWLKLWLSNQTVNGQTVAARNEVEFLKCMVVPWLNRAGYTGFNNSQWETTWDGANEDSLLKYAPFKLTAIVNRIDLRGNSAYSGNLFNAGETRLIFTLVAADRNALPGTNMFPYGSIPIHNNTGILPSDALDWMGMNIIFEYGNVQQDLCAVKAFAQKWKDLGSLTLGSAKYNAALEDITNTVTTAGAVPGKPNGSAINRIRTSEKIFAGNGNSQEWVTPDWEFRQFELDPNTHKLVEVSMTNTPKAEGNFASNISLTPGPNSFQENLLDLVFGSPGFKSALANGTHNLPPAYRAGSALISKEYAHYWGLDFTRNTTKYNPANYPNNTAHLPERTLRNQLSLNTCQGCHTGETKTVFSHVRPRPFGTPARYWISTPDTDPGTYDRIPSRGHNDGYTVFANNQVENYKATCNQNCSVDRISAFLTGRTYANSSWDDDNTDPGNEDVSDNAMDGLYYVNDPDNGSPTTLEPQTIQNGYNDLERRKIDMCRLLTNNCDNTDVLGAAEVHDVIEILGAVKFMPFAQGAH